MKSRCSIPRIESSEFDWLTWRTGSPLDVFGLRCRTDDLVAGSAGLLAHAVGYCPAGRIPCRPKPDNTAVMFFKNGRHFWFHLRDREFELIFG